MDRRRRTHNWTLVLRRFDRHLVDAQRVVAAVIAVQTVGAATWWQTLGIDQKARRPFTFGLTGAASATVRMGDLTCCSKCCGTVRMAGLDDRLPSTTTRPFKFQTLSGSSGAEGRILLLLMDWTSPAADVHLTFPF